MCWSCDGNVPIDAESCPFCGVALDHTIPKSDYKPPYRLAKQEETQAIPVAPMLKPEGFAVENEDSYVDQTKKVMITLGCLSAGLILLLFGSILAIFAGADDMLVLRWDARYWYLYFVVSIPLLIIGWRALGSIVDHED